jgi:hypothetical protein
MSDEAYLVEEIALLKKHVRELADLLSEVAEYGVICPQNMEILEKIKGGK